jgi:hypothetical protein
MFIVVAYGDEYIQMRKQLLYGGRIREPDGIVSAVTPFGKMGVDRMSFGVDGIAERFEERAQHLVPTPYRQDRYFYLQGHGFVYQLRLVLAASIHGCGKCFDKGGAHKGAGYIGSVVDILLQGKFISGGTAAASHQADGVDVQQEADGTSFF